MKKYLQYISRGIINENPIFRLLLGMCPVLGVTSKAEYGLGMGLAATAVLLCSNVVISSMRRFIPAQVRIPCYIVIIATFVTMVDMLLKAFLPALHASLGIFVPLIVVNCIILGRAEAFAGKKPVVDSFFDGLGIGAGFTAGLLLLSSFREILGNGTIFGHDIMGASFQPMALMVLPPGAFIALGVLLALVNVVFYKLRIE